MSSAFKMRGIYKVNYKAYRCLAAIIMKVRKKAKIRNLYNQVPRLTQDATWESDKNTRKNRIQENQEASLFPAGDQKAALNRQESTTNMTHKSQKGYTKEATPWNSQ